jgi:hemerythrin-like domain-containing protein
LNPIETLVSEHRLIERLLDDLERWAREPEDRAGLGPLVRVLVDYVPQHHGKEQDLMFSASLEDGHPRRYGAYAAMEAEYDHARALAHRLLELHGQTLPWSERDRVAAAETAYEYASVMRHHIRREGEVLYPAVWSDWMDG